MKLYLNLILRGRRISLLAPGLFSWGGVATAASAFLMNREMKSRDFVQALWNAGPEPYWDGYFDPYHDGLLYLSSLMHVSGKCQIIQPQVH